MGWQDISKFTVFLATTPDKILISCQPMPKLTTQYGFLFLIMAQIRYISDLEPHKDYSHKAWLKFAK